MVILLSGEIDFRHKKNTEDKEKYYIIIKH